MVKIPKKAALICALVMLISVVPAFALNETNTTTTDQTQDQNCTGNQDQDRNQSKQGSCDSAGENCGSCDGDQHKYQYGQGNSASGTSNGDQSHQYQYGQGNGNAGTENCDGTNCKNTS
ncbi:hypothetical protein [Methanobacterium sp.]|uniref:hypothetical protein n=1 Tax=Methanobacterium sp. TaxID=2164 RepID=UPI002ABAAE22|nr:hypothetical protein [Methanobacterium sp.]MDY9923653.1 hypothetical protein [Methanobacterium sp.]